VRAVAVAQRLAPALNNGCLAIQGPPGSGKTYVGARIDRRARAGGEARRHLCHRFNVAVSRAWGLAVLVCSPDLLTVRCRTPKEMRLANALCRFVELSQTG
jgi:hypothetical protein